MPAAIRKLKHSNEKAISSLRTLTAHRHPFVKIDTKVEPAAAADV